MKRFLLMVCMVCVAQLAKAEPMSEQVVATVNGVDIAVDEYVYIAQKAVSGRFYHGQVPEAELKAYWRQLLDELVDSYLLAVEARSRGLEADSDKVVGTVEGFETQAAQRAGWAAVKTVWLARIAGIARRESLQGRLEAQVKSDVVPDEGQVRQYYQDHLDKFVRPQQQDVSTILLSVDPSSSSAVWQQAKDRAAELKGELDSGASFEALAEMHSADPSAGAGGEMGLLHRGLLGGAVEAALAELTPGQVSEPLKLLDGIVLLRLNARFEEQQMAFESVQQRATGLLIREMGELAWEALRFRLRNQADIQLNEALLERLGV